MSPSEQRWKRRADALLGVAASTILLLMMALTVADVVARYIFNRPLRGAFEVTELMLLVLIFAGLPLVSFSDEHAVMDQVVQNATLLRFPDRTEMRVELSPPQLGTIHLHLTQQATALTVHLRADDPQVQQLLASNIDQLSSRLQDQGHSASVDLTWDRDSSGLTRDLDRRDAEGNPSAQNQPETSEVPPAPLAPTEPVRGPDRRVDYRA